MARGRQIKQSFISVEGKTIREVADEFYKHNKAKGLAIESQKAYIYKIEDFIKYCNDDLLIQNVNNELIDNYIFFKLEEVKAITIATIMRHLRTFFNFCAARGYMSKLELTIPKYEQEPKEPYTEDEMRKLLKKPKGDNWVEYRNWVMVNYFFSTGQRLATVLGIKVCHVNLERSTVKLEHNKDKIKKVMPLSKALVAILAEYIELSGLREEDYLFPEYEGKQFSRRGAEQAIEKYNRSRGVKKTSIHLFRHTFAKCYIINGGNPAKLQKLLNHKTIDMTMKYVNLYGADLASDLELFNPLDSFKRQNNKRIKLVG